MQLVLTTVSLNYYEHKLYEHKHPSLFISAIIKQQPREGFMLYLKAAVIFLNCGKLILEEFVELIT